MLRDTLYNLKGEGCTSSAADHFKLSGTNTASSLSIRPADRLCEGGPRLCAGAVQQQPVGAAEDPARRGVPAERAESAQTALPGQRRLCGPDGVGRDRGAG